MKIPEMKYFTPEEAAEYLGVKVNTLSQWRTNEKGPEFIKNLDNGRVTYAENVLFEYRKNRRKQGRPRKSV